MKIDELIKQINEAEANCAKYIKDDVDLGNAEEICTIDQDEHRWYTLGTVVFKVGDKFLGVCGPVSLKSESMGFDDLCIPCEAFEMEAVPSVTYKKK